MASTLSPSEAAQLEQTIEMFEVITQSQPHDYQSLEILKEAGVDIARRTVAKYREAMRIPSSVDRRRMLKEPA